MNHQSSFSLRSFFQPVDLTQGTCWKTLLVFAFPIIVSYLLQQALPDVLCHTLTSQFSAQFSQFQCLFHKAQEQAGKILGNLLQIGIVTVIAPDSAAL